MTAATAEFKTAQGAYDKASKPTLDKVHDGDEYKAASAAHEFSPGFRLFCNEPVRSPILFSSSAIRLNMGISIQKRSIYAMSR